MEKIQNQTDFKYFELNQNSQFVPGTHVYIFIPETGVKENSHYKSDNAYLIYKNDLSKNVVFNEKSLSLISGFKRPKNNHPEYLSANDISLPRDLTDVEKPMQDLASFTRECFKDIGGVELELPPRGKMRKPPKFS